MNASLLLLALAFPLEWNTSFRTDVPYEVDLSPAKLQAQAFSVLADGKPLAVQTFPGRLPGNVTLRFSVPPGTKALTAETVGRAGAPRPPLFDDPFAGACTAANADKWSLGPGMSVKAVPDGLEFLARDKTSDAVGTGRARNLVSYEVALPADWAGKPVVQEIELENRCALVASDKSYIEQLDAKGNVLPETVADIRWTSHMRPTGKSLAYRDEGHIHPLAKRLRFVATVSGSSSKFDAYGYPLADPNAMRTSTSRAASRISSSTHTRIIRAWGCPAPAPPSVAASARLSCAVSAGGRRCRF